MRERLSRNVTERLRALAWWDWSHDDLRAALDDFRSGDIESFLQKHGA